MIISDMTATFGNLENSTLSLSEGLNIIDGANETGKSTWCAFIRSMLYGVSSSERDSKVSLAVKNRYRPWSGSPMSGTMKAHTEEFGELTLERRTTTPSAPMRDFQAYSPLGEEISLSYTDVGEQLLGIDLSCFERSAFIETPRLPFGGTSELERRILALVSSGEEKSSYTDARSLLEGWQRKLEFRGNGKIPELEQRIRLLKSDLDICKRNSAELDDVQLKILSLESERVALLKNIAEMKTEFNDSIRDRVQAAQTRLINARQEVLDASEMLPSGDPIPTVDELRMLEQRFFFEQEKKRTAQAQSALQREKLRRLDEYRLHLSEHKPFGGCTAKEAKDIVTKDINKLTALTVGGISRSIFLKLSPFLLVSLAVSVLMLIMSRELIGGIPSWVIPALLILVSPFILIVSSRSKAKKRIDTITKAVLEKYGAKSQDEILQILNSYVALIDEYTRMKDDADSNLRSSQTEKSSEDVISRIMNIFPTFNNAAEIEGGLSDAVHSAVTAIDNYNRRILSLIHI